MRINASLAIVTAAQKFREIVRAGAGAAEVVFGDAAHPLELEEGGAGRTHVSAWSLASEAASGSIVASGPPSGGSMTMPTGP